MAEVNRHKSADHQAILRKACHAAGERLFHELVARLPAICDTKDGRLAAARL
jgi:hypothetical protein